ncbi:MAG TPA: HAMP domain-containing sensor histidine kinase [Isosphaeraceae bacterium]|jgi:signal transduction histidine kinase|nr:HAMP domain-containing sensor histidine kinase [Isosphaeraceae bacterium]
MKRPLVIWLAFGLCVVLAAVAMQRLGAMALDLERAEARTRRQAALDENLQLALWRMDSDLAPLIAEEGTRPYFTYTPFYPAERAYTHMLEAVDKGDVLVASPLLTYASPRVHLHFQFGPDGRLTSPQVPDGNLRDLAESRFIPPARLEASARRLDELSRLVSRPAMAVACSSDAASPTASPGLRASFPALPGAEKAPQSRGSKEYAMRSLNARKARSANLGQSPLFATAEAVSQGPIQAAWIDDALILGRRVRVGQATLLQGCWLDWDAIRSELLGDVSDLLPNADLEPVRTPDETPTRRLAALPARLVIRPAPAEAESSRSPARLSLWIAWGCLSVAAGAVALLLGGALSLSERRGTFVSAVTHELRTPLTTFRLYTEMLSEGIVGDPEARGSYLRTLRVEADRLGHLVENVLSFARLERGRSIDRRDELTARDLLDRVRPSLAARADRGGMELAIGADIPDVRLRTDASVVEQVLANLVDNATKYANGASDRRIHLGVAASGARLALSVRDHGPGLPRRAVRRLFRPFSKSALDAAHSAPGVGLGLALSRRLARALGGNLRLQHNGPDGVGFVLTLPIEPRRLGPQGPGPDVDPSDRAPFKAESLDR